MLFYLFVKDVSGGFVVAKIFVDGDALCDKTGHWGGYWFVGAKVAFCCFCYKSFKSCLSKLGIGFYCVRVLIIKSLSDSLCCF